MVAISRSIQPRSPRLAIVTGAMMRPLLIDLKFSLTEIGQIIGVVSCSAGIIGSFVGGSIVNKWGVEGPLFVATGLCLLSVLLVQQWNAGGQKLQNKSDNGSISCEL